MAWDGSLYAANTQHHRAFDGEFLAPLRIDPAWNVLDVGCGAGDLTARVAGLVPRGLAVGLDSSSSMIAAARAHRAPNLEFVVGRAQEAAGAVGRWRPFHLALSTAALHWVPAAEHPAVLGSLRALLAPGGVFRAEFGGQGQIERARAILDEESARLGGGPGPWYYPGAEEYLGVLTTAGFAVPPGGVRLLFQRRRLPDPAALLGWLRSQVLIAYDAGLEPGARPEFRRRAEARALAGLRREDGTYDQDYVRLDLLATSP